MKIRSDIPNQSATVATLNHGERVQLLQRRRSFLKVRAPNGAEGWTEERQLLAVQDMESLSQLAARAAKMPAQGQAVADAEVRVRTQPARQAPSFLLLKVNEKVDVISHMPMPRDEPPHTTPLIPPAPKKTKSTAKKPARKDPKYPPPPLPKPPGLPPDWIELSKTGEEGGELAPAEDPGVQKPKVMADWSLVRTAGGQAGWVPTRALRMAIDDDVAQYAEGRRIVSYFSLGELQDGDLKKHVWLWTTIGGSLEPYDFDSFRVFIWSLRRHRYETAYIERNLKGYAPVLLKEVQFSAGGKAKAGATTASYPGFSICTENKEGARYWREFALLTNVVRFAGQQPCEAPAPVEGVKAPAPLPAGNAPAQQPPETFTHRVKKWFHSITKGGG